MPLAPVKMNSSASMRRKYGVVTIAIRAADVVLDLRELPSAACLSAGGAACARTTVAESNSPRAIAVDRMPACSGGATTRASNGRRIRTAGVDASSIVEHDDKRAVDGVTHEADEVTIDDRRPMRAQKQLWRQLLASVSSEPRAVDRHPPWYATE